VRHVGAAVPARRDGRLVYRAPAKRGQTGTYVVDPHPINEQAENDLRAWLRAVDRD
jgi:hypothetical protein